MPEEENITLNSTRNKILLKCKSIDSAALSNQSKLEITNPLKEKKPERGTKPSLYIEFGPYSMDGAIQWGVVQ